ncbi:hypothetical protein RJ640_013025 [Escallonia rubra]|uniref:Programmed cell death protein 2 C-terminal domain-containing protein n=1 Tax=Escallonia rubra TaxID=112253 RepID=A0AA88U5G2_9ASTE|nr:hypothetical protein RJ640_013025 [Escallonia rubra]
MGDIILGMPGPWADDNTEKSDHYTSKIGGLPDWPTSNFVVRPKLLECGACGSNLCLVAQIYAPISSKALTIEERVIYILGCVKPKCGSSPVSWRALRVQRSTIAKEPGNLDHEVVPLATNSVFASKVDSLEDSWSFDCGEEKDDRNGDDLDLEELGRALSEAASLASHSKKQDCHEHYQATVKPSHNNQTTGVADSTKSVLPCFYIYTQEDKFSKEVASVCLSYTSLSIKACRSDLDDHAPGESWEEEGYEYDRALSADRTYLKFKKRMDANPEQCLSYNNLFAGSLRYSFGGKPLLATRETGDPITCELCGGSRHYEMQLMPPLLYFLQEASQGLQKESLENWNWMTLVSCSAFLDQQKSESDGWIVAEETVVLQFE